MADEDDGLDGEEPESGIFRWMSALVVLLAVAGFFGLAWYAYKNGGEAVDEKDVELVKADKGPVKEAPANPGGMQIPNQDKTVYGLISGKQQKQPVVERILPAPEEPITRSGDTETWINSSMKNKAINGGTDEKPATSAPAPEANEQTQDAPKQFNPGKIRAQGQETSISPHVAMVASAEPETTPGPLTPPAPEAKPPAPPAKAATPAPEHKIASASTEDSDEDKPAKPETKPETKPAAKPPAGARAQLGSYRSAGEAESNWSKIADRFSDDLKSKQHYVVKADLGSKGIYYRLQVAPFASPKDAEQFCIDFVSAGQGCILARGK